MAAKIIKFYEPDYNGKRLYKVYVIHKDEVRKVIVANWKKKYGEDYVEVVNG